MRSARDLADAAEDDRRFQLGPLVSILLSRARARARVTGLGLLSRFRQKTTTPADVARLRTSREVRGGIIQGRPVSAEEIATLATLPSLDVLRGQVVGAIAAPLVTVVGLFDAPLRDLVGVLQARIDQLQAQGES